MRPLLKKAIKKSFNAFGLEVRKVSRLESQSLSPSHVEEFRERFSGQAWVSPQAKEFGKRFNSNLSSCLWEPHALYNVFTQYDQEYYLMRKEAFLHKYRCFYAVSKTISPKRIVELGTHAGSSADAYISASPNAEYIGLDQFEDGVLRGITHQVHNRPWQPRRIAEQLFESRGFKKYELLKVDLRTLDALPTAADFVVVDAAHDAENEYADLNLALTAKPSFIFVDDVYFEARTAIEKFVNDDLRGQVEYLFLVDYIGGGLVIKLKTASHI